MKKRILIIPGLLALLPGQALAQSGLDQEVAFSYYTLPFLELKIYRLEWWGHQGRTYFTQASDDLVNWAYFQEIDSGNDEVIWYEVPENGDKIFLRLQYTDQPTADPFTSDFDGDHVSNWDEITMSPVQGNPLDDSSVDGDLIPDDWEHFHGLDPTLADGYLHSDEDRLSNYEEFLNYTDPKDADSDDDYLSDDWEVTYALNPLADEGIALDDTDGDGLQNYIESTANTNPFSGDTDSDLLPDQWEFLNGTDPTLDDADDDGDDDGLVNSLEYANNLNPRIPDTDGDGLSDGDEVLVYNTSGNIEDSDGDGWIDGSEVLAGSSPTDNSAVPDPVIRILSGNGQVAAAGTPLQGSFQFSIETADGTPLPKAPVALSASSPTFGQDGGAFLIADPGTQQGPTVPSGYTFVEVEQVSLAADRNGTVLGVGSPVFLKIPVSANIDDVIDISVQSGGSTTHLQATVVSQQDAPVIPPSNLSSTLIDAQTHTHQVTWTNTVTSGPGYTIAVQLNNGSWMTLGTAGPTSSSFSASVPSGVTNPNFRITGANSNSSPSAQSIPLESSFAEVDLGQCYPFNLNTNGQVLAEVNLEVKRWDFGTWESLTMPSNLGWVVDFYDLNNNGSMLGYELINDRAEYIIWDSSDSPMLKQLPNFLGLPDVFMSFINGLDDRKRVYGKVDLTGIGVYADISFIGDKILLTEASNSSPAHDFWGFFPGIHNGSGDFVGTINEWSPSTSEFFTRRINGGNFEVLDYMPVAIGKDGTTLGLELNDPNIVSWSLDSTNLGDELIVDDGSSRLKIPLSEFAAAPDWGTGISTGNPDGSWYSHSCGFLIHSDMAEKEQFVVGPGALFRRLFSQQGVALGFQKYTMPEGFFPTDVSENGMIVGYRSDEYGNPQGILLLDIKLAVDGDRSGTEFDPEIESGANDLTSEETPYHFWLNDDDDVDDDDPDKSENVPVSIADYTDDTIDGIRDLEDFSRLKVYLGGLQDAILQGQIQIGLKWKDATGSPSLKVWRNCSPNGGTEYLTELTVAQQHLALRAPGLVEGTTPYIIPTQYWADVGLSASQPYGNLLFEGCTAGKGQLVITLHKADGTEIGEGPGIWFDLKNIKAMYERVKATADGAEIFPFPYNHVGSDPVPAPLMGWIPDPNGFPFEPAPGESATYIVFVHGWNQTYERSTMYAETIFKRLWHRGFKGRFVCFRWPTFTGLTSYNDSEYRAWKCGLSLKQYLDTLPNTYTINLVAHSMGNIVAGSALEKGASVANYALLNAAVPAICYDTSGTVVQVGWGYETPNDDPDSATVSLSYQGRLANISGNLVNFFLPADSALAAWEINNDSPSGGRYPVVGARPHQWPEGSINAAGYHYQRTAMAGQKLRVVRVAGERILNSADEAMGFAVQAPSLTIGADGRTRGSIDDWVDMTAYGFDSVHSAEFLFTFHQTRDFYGALLLKLGVAVQP